MSQLSLSFLGSVSGDLKCLVTVDFRTEGWTGFHLLSPSLPHHLLDARRRLKRLGSTSLMLYGSLSSQALSPRCEGERGPWNTTGQAGQVWISTHLRHPDWLSWPPRGGLQDAELGGRAGVTGVLDSPDLDWITFKTPFYFRILWSNNLNSTYLECSLPTLF